ncbi:hypothetical protein KP509_03G008600 [Ceratopteris richardii]|uniref:Pentatricopeptide repeat-containing protein n=2 Tax=Ceratopteris richardii TaxID=49495 RepID=A0A8T2V8V2_CERRI|nr:hypothetical protein KP509_03G008600 [Ceratopteris richardii]
MVFCYALPNRAQCLMRSLCRQRRDGLLCSYGGKVVYTTEGSLYNLMDKTKIRPTKSLCYNTIYSPLLHNCIEEKSWTNGKQIYNHMIIDGCQLNPLLGNLLLEMYLSCGCVKDAKKLFDTLHSKNLGTWITLFRGYVSYDRWEESLSLFWKMWRDGVMPNSYIFVILFQTCAQLLDLEDGKVIFSCLVKSGCKLTRSVASSLVSMYTKCGCVSDAQSVFDRVSSRNVILWSAMLAGYAHQGQPKVAIESFWEMQNDNGIQPNEIVCITILKACSMLGSHDEGRKVHDCVLRNSFDLTLSVVNTLIDMYAKCGCLTDARSVFNNIPQPDLISWSAMIAGYGESGNILESFKLYSLMESRGAIKAIADLENIEDGRCIHFALTQDGLETEFYVVSALVDMYGKCGAVKDARRVFDCMPQRNIIVWSTIISCYTQQTTAEEAIELFCRMQREKVQPDEIILVSIFKVCTMLGMLEQGRHIHNYSLDMGIAKDSSFLASTLIDMYTRCGSLIDARGIFDLIKMRDTPLWNAMMSGYAQYGLPLEAFRLFSEMWDQDVPANHVTFVGLLSACSHAGLLHAGLQVFNWVSLDCPFSETTEQCACLVDLLGRVGCQTQAVAFVQEMPFQPDVTIWLSLVGVCRLNCNLELAIVGVKNLLEIEPGNAAVLVLLSNIVYEVD